ncbi:MAG TPA: succinate--CoA ligase subunit alpha [Ignavibacteriales bacterium]|nr:succinate--CoA ligase subunit alpha [Ignavibacteriales bacterium]
MSILVDKNTRLVVQGITGSEGSFHTKQMIEYGTKVVAGVTPGKGGTEHEGVPVYNTVADAVKEQGANASIIFVPPAFAADAILESANAGVKLVICITEGIPTKDMVKVYNSIKHKDVVLIGPNCPGVISPGKAKVGIMPGFIGKQGKIGVVSRSGTLTYEAVKQLTDLNIGQSTCVGIGGDPVIGSKFLDIIKKFNEDSGTEGIVMIGEIGGSAEEEAAAYIKKFVKKPVVGFIAGKTAPAGRRMGHAGAIISGGKGTAADKMEAMKKAGIYVVESPAEIGVTMQKALAKTKAKTAAKPAKKAAAKKKTAAKPAAKKTAVKSKAKPAVKKAVKKTAVKKTVKAKSKTSKKK